MNLHALQALTRFFVATEERILSDKPARVAAQQVGIETWVAQRRCAVVVRGRSRPDLLQLFKEGMGVLLDQRIRATRVRPVRLIRSTNIAPCIVDNDPCRTRLPARHIPGVLETNVSIDIPGTDPWPGTRPVPEACIELQLQLRVGPVAQLGDGRLLETVEASLAVIQGPQDTEWDGQDHPVEGGRLFPAGCGEGQRITPVAVGGDGRHTPVEVNGPGGQTVCNRRGQLLVPPDDVVALIRFAEDAKIARLRLKAEQIDQVQRTLDIRLATVLLVIGNIEEL